MASYNPKTYDAILADMEAWIIANQDYITDFNEGSGVTSFCEAVAQQIEQVYIRGKIGFIKYLPDLPFYAFGFSKKAGTQAAGAVIFSRAVATTDPVTIPTGTLVSTASGIIYATTADGTILANQTDSGSVPILAQDVGVDGNVLPGTVVVMTTPVVGVDSVNNPSACTGGTDEEDDATFQQRFRNYILGLGKSNTYGIQSAAESVSGVRSASVIENFPPVTGFYNITVYVDDGAGNAPPALIADVLAAIKGDGTAANPGYKASGINVQVLAPTKVTVAVTVEIIDTGDVDRTALQTSITTAISDYINNLKVGEDVIVNELVQRIMEVVGVYDLTLTDPPANVSIGPTQIARTGTITVTFYSP